MKTKPRFSQQHWEDLCLRNGFGWLIRHDIWRRTWGGRKWPNHVLRNGTRYFQSTPGTLVGDPEGKGFLLLRKTHPLDVGPCCGDVEVYCVLVDEGARRTGVMSRLMQRATRKLHPKKSFWLEGSFEDAVQAFYKVGFRRIRDEMLQTHNKHMEVRPGNGLLMLRPPSESV